MRSGRMPSDANMITLSVEASGSTRGAARAERDDERKQENEHGGDAAEFAAHENLSSPKN